MRACQRVRTLQPHLLLASAKEEAASTLQGEHICLQLLACGAQLHKRQGQLAFLLQHPFMLRATQ